MKRGRGLAFPLRMVVWNVLCRFGRVESSESKRASRGGDEKTPLAHKSRTCTFVPEMELPRYQRLV